MTGDDWMRWKHHVQMSHASIPDKFYNLPQPSDLRSTVTLFREQLERFRGDFQMLAEFASAVCGVPLPLLTPATLLDYAYKQWRKENPNK